MRMNSNAILEIGCEEIPARFMPGLLESLKNKAEEKLAGNRLSFEKIETFGTPRRLVLFVGNLSAKQPDINQEVQGPPAEIAFDENNRPTQAAFGFAKKNGVEVNDLKMKTVGNRNYVAAVIKKKGLPTKKVLETLFPEIISSIYIPLAMRWGDLSFQFIRPIHWFCSMYGNQVVRFELAGIKSSNKSYGHRFQKGTITLLSASIEEFSKKLLKAGVVLDQEKRKASIKALVLKTAPKAILDNALLNEVNHLVENPAAMLGNFNPEFLALPKEVLITTMKKNQKYFPVLGKDGQLASQFVVITNGLKAKNIIEGNQKVLTARLTDAKFFFEEDKKTNLESRLQNLKNVEYFKKLGTMYEKTERLRKLSEYIAKHLKVNEQLLPIIDKIATLSKCDLVTQMVFEFPELEGIMGREYAKGEGLDPQIAEGIFEHRLQRSADDELPKSMPGIVVSLADKIDTIVGCFSVGAIPTGSEDPYGLRRCAHGIIKIILENELDLLLDETVVEAAKLYHNTTFDTSKVAEFVAGRLKVILQDGGIPYDAADAVLQNLNDVFESFKVAKVLAKYQNEDWIQGIRATADRIDRLSKGAQRAEVIEADLEDENEKAVHQLFLKINWEVMENVNNGDYEGALRSLSSFTAPIESFFKSVMVMHEDPRLKTNRLALLKSISKTFHEVADFTKLVA